MERVKLFLSLGLIFFLIGCSSGLRKAIREHQKVSHMIKLGDSKSKVIKILAPTQKGLYLKDARLPEKYLEGNDRVEIYFIRSRHIADGLTTDDEFTPYCFKNGVLTGIGWQQLGGAKSHGQVVPQTNISTSTTIIDY